MNSKTKPEPVPVVGGHSIKTAAHLTGIAIETLRVWERRYGFPKPVRRETGRRHYSGDDIARLQLIARVLQTGFRPGEIIHYSTDQLLRLLEGQPPTRDLAAMPQKEATGTAVERLVELLLLGNIDELQRLLRALAASHGPKPFVVDLAQPFAVRVGELWARGKLEIHQEHIASECVSTQLRLLLAQSLGATPAPLVLLGNLPDEPHRLPLELVAVYLAASQATPQLLGLQTPPREFAASARSLRADVVGVTVTAPPADERAKARLAELRLLLPGHVALWVGGAHAAEVAPPGAEVISSWSALDGALQRRSGGALRRK